MYSIYMGRCRGRFPAAVIVLLLALSVACGRSVPDIAAAELLQRISADDAPLILDVRSDAEFASGHVPGAINIPHNEVAARLAELGDREGEVVVYCESGRRAARALSLLGEAGFTRLRHLSGDMAGWRGAGLPQAR